MIARLDGGLDALDVGAHHRSLAGILTPALFCLAGAFTCGEAVGQCMFLLPEFEAR